MKITFADGHVEEFPKPVTQAFAALARGDASGGQQKLCLQVMFQLTQPFGFCPANASERVAGMTEGGRLVGVQLAQLVGGETPWTLRHLGDITDDSRND